jgi:hypothetical protein
MNAERNSDLPQIGSTFARRAVGNTYNNRENRRAAEEAKREHYRAEVAAAEARKNGYTLLELKANPPAQLTGPKLIRRPIVVQPKSEEDQQVA